MSDKKINVYKTSVKSQKEINLLEPHLMELLGNSNWNFDLEDCDNILRLEMGKCCNFDVVNMLRGFGFECEELPD